MAQPPKAGFSNYRAPLGAFQTEMMDIIEQLKSKAYGAEIERAFEERGNPTDQGQVYGATIRLVQRGFLEAGQIPDPGRPGTNYKVKVFKLTKAGRDAIKASRAIYDPARFMKGKP